MVRTWENEHWRLLTAKGSILDSVSMDKAEQRLAIPVPEMIFGTSEIKLSHSSGWSLEFNALDALDTVGKTGDSPGMLQVSYTNEWRKARQGKSPHDISKIHRPFDWTYSAKYEGKEQPRLLKPDPTVSIPFDKLRVPKPILFYDEVPLFEDELGDNGMVTYTGKIRVMETELLLLVRLYMRVDNVAFRIRDTRVYVDFTTNEVIRTYVEKEDSFKNVLRRVPTGTTDHTLLLRDPNWIDGVLPTVFSSTAAVALAGHTAGGT